MKRIVCGLMIVVWLGMLVGGCNQTDRSTNQTNGNQVTAQEKARVLIDESQEKTAILNGNLALPDVAAFVDTLQSWGYDWRPGNCVVFIQPSYYRDIDWQSSENNGIVSAKARPEQVGYVEPADTVVWQVFENAQRDSTKFSAIVTGYNNGRTNSAFVEVDISSDSLNFIRGTTLRSVDWSMDDPMAKGFWKAFGTCMLLASIRCAFNCLYAGPAYLQCVAGCIGWSSITCAAAAAFSWLKGN